MQHVTLETSLHSRNRKPKEIKIEDQSYKSGEKENKSLTTNFAEVT